MKTVVFRSLGQLVAFAMFIGLVGALAPGPAYRHLDAGLATIKLSLRHAGAPIAPCRERTAEELAQLAPNMRQSTVCPRERSPLVLELALDDRVVFDATLLPRGIHRDGRASVYQRLSVPAGDIDVKVRLKDDARIEGYQYQRTQRVKLAPADVLVIDFDAERGDFVFDGGSLPPRTMGHPAGGAE